jgi:hypothetical protein
MKVMMKVMREVKRSEGLFLIVFRSKRNVVEVRISLTRRTRGFRTFRTKVRHFG